MSKASSGNMGKRSSLRKNIKKSRGFGTMGFYLSSEETMAGTKKVRTYKEWDDLLNGELGRIIGIVD